MVVDKVPVVVAGQSLLERVQVLRVWVSVRGRWPSEVAGDDEEKRLGRWVQYQRYRHRQGVMSAERQAELQTIPGWSWGSAEPVMNRERGDARLAQLDTWMRRYGRAPRQTLPGSEEAKLALWAARQRRKHQVGMLSPARVEALDGIPGWTWLMLTRKITATADVYEQWLAEHGREPTRGEECRSEVGRKLALWAAMQRHRFRQGRMPAPAADRLAAIPGWTWALLK